MGSRGWEERHSKADRGRCIGPCKEVAHVCHSGAVSLIRLGGVDWGNMGSTDLESLC